VFEAEEAVEVVAGEGREVELCEAGRGEEGAEGERAGWGGGGPEAEAARGAVEEEGERFGGVEALGEVGAGVVPEELDGLCGEGAGEGVGERVEPARAVAVWLLGWWLEGSVGERGESAPEREEALCGVWVRGEGEGVAGVALELPAEVSEGAAAALAAVGEEEDDGGELFLADEVVKERAARGAEEGELEWLWVLVSVCLVGGWAERLSDLAEGWAARGVRVEEAGDGEACAVGEVEVGEFGGVLDGVAAREEGLRHDDAEGEAVGGGVGGLSAEALVGEVAGGAAAAAVAVLCGEAEVDEARLGVLVGVVDEDVLGLEVSVDEAGAVERLDGFGEECEECESLLGGEVWAL
jgi:hypothetical protein